MSIEKKTTLKDFPFTYWISIVFEFFERGSYYGMMSVLSIYLIDQLGFQKQEVGLIKSTIQPLLYFLPIITGAIADRVGYRKTLMVAFGLLGTGYFLTSQTTSYGAVFASLFIMGLGAGTFKPVISGTIAKVTNEKTSSLGFGIFYWTINLGAFLFPLIIVPWLKSMNWSYIMIAAAILTGGLIIPTIFIYKEPKREIVDKEPLGKTIASIFGKILLVVKDWRFMLFIFIYSWFWILYFQMFDTVLWYVKDFVDPSALNELVKSITGLNFKFDVEHVTVVNAFTIILLQIVISNLIKNVKPLTTIVTGISIATCGMAIMAINSNIWVFIAGIFIFSIGEMTAHPKYISYLGLIAPADKKATYMGFGFLYGFFGSSIAGVLGAKLYVVFIDNPMIEFIRTRIPTLPANVNVKEAMKAAQALGISKEQIAAYAHPSQLWLIFSCIGLMCIIGLLTYTKIFGAKKIAE